MGVVPRQIKIKLNVTRCVHRNPPANHLIRIIMFAWEMKCRQPEFCTHKPNISYINRSTRGVEIFPYQCLFACGGIEN